MPVVEESVFIARPPRVVFEFITDPAKIPVWDTSVVAAEQIGNDPIGPGMRTRGTSQIMGRQFDWVTEQTVFEPPTRSVLTSIEGLLTFTVTNTLEAVEGGTRLTYRIDADAGLGGVFGRLADPFIEKAQARTMRANLDTLAELLAEHPEG